MLRLIVLLVIDFTYEEVVHCDVPVGKILKQMTANK